MLGRLGLVRGAAEFYLLLTLFAVTVTFRHNVKYKEMGMSRTINAVTDEKNGFADRKKREIDKIGYTRVVSEQNRVPFFSRRGALAHVCKTPPKRVLAPEPTTPCVRAAPQTVFSVFDPSKQRQ